MGNNWETKWEQNETKLNLIKHSIIRHIIYAFKI